jgi:hypothetical protein
MDPNIKNVYLIYQGGRSDDKKICYCVSVTLVVLEELMQCEKKTNTTSAKIMYRSFSWGPFGPQQHSRVKTVGKYLAFFIYFTALIVMVIFALM